MSQLRREKPTAKRVQPRTFQPRNLPRVLGLIERPSPQLAYIFCLLLSLFQAGWLSDLPTSASADVTQQVASDPQLIPDPSSREKCGFHYKDPLQNSKSDPERTRVIIKTLPHLCPPRPHTSTPILTMGVGIFFSDVWGSASAQLCRCLRHRGSRVYMSLTRSKVPKPTGAEGFSQGPLGTTPKLFQLSRPPLLCSALALERTNPSPEAKAAHPIPGLWHLFWPGIRASLAAFLCPSGCQVGGSYSLDLFMPVQPFSSSQTARGDLQRHLGFLTFA